MSENLTTWSTADFERMSWHDCHVHGLSIRDGQHGAGELELDLDYIVEWCCHDDGSCDFRVAPALLTFHEVVGLRIEIDYAAVQAGMAPFSLDRIERELIAYPPATNRFSGAWW